MPIARSLASRNTIAPVAANSDFITSFPTVENPISQGGIWDRGLEEGLKWTSPQVTANGCVASEGPTPNRFDDDIAVLKRTYRAFANNQFVQGVMYLAPGYNANGGKHECEMWLRGQITANNARGYECSIGMQTSFGTYAFCTRWDGAENSFTTLIDPANGTGSYTHTPTAIADGDVYRVEITGTTITFFQNGIVIFTVTDSTFSSGNPGVGFWPVDGAIVTSMGFKSYRAGDLP